LKNPPHTQSTKRLVLNVFTLVFLCETAVHAAPLALIRDSGLRKAASIHAKQILQDEKLAHLDTVMGVLGNKGIADAQVLPFAVIGKSLSELEIALKAFEEQQALPRAYTHRGVAYRKSKDGMRFALVGLFSRRLIDIPSLPTKVAVNRRQRIRVLPSTIQAFSDDQIYAYVSNPSGSVTKLKLQRDWKTGEAEFELPFRDGPGRYVFETLINGPRGPEVTALWRFDVGDMPKRTREPPEKMKLPDTRETINALLRRARIQSKLKQFRSNEVLDTTALAHATRVCEQRIAAHILPGGVSPSARVRRHGYTGAVTENVAMAQTVARAHENLMESPSHRANIIDARFTEVGIGLVSRPAKAASSRFDRRPARTWCVVQLFGNPR